MHVPDHLWRSRHGVWYYRWVVPERVRARNPQLPKEVKKSTRTADIRLARGVARGFPGWSTAKPLEQAERQAPWLTNWATKSTGTAVRATPVVALPGWFVERTGRGSVRGFSGKELGLLLKLRGPFTLGKQLVVQVVYEVEQRCRTVVPPLRDK